MANSASSSSKSSFLEEWLKSHPQSKESEVAEAWKSAGNSGTISPSLFYKIKSDLGLHIRKRRGGAKRTKHAKHVGALKKGRGVKDKTRAEAPVEAYSGTKGSTVGVTVMERSRVEPVHRRSASAQTLVALEGDLDRLIFQLMNVGGLEDVEELLRQARRVLARSHKG
jgi:hypothetical protein